MNVAEQRTIIFSAFFLNAAGFAVFSFLAVYLAVSVGLSGWETGLILSVLTLSSRGLPFFMGILGDRLGYKHLMITGLLIRSIGFLGLASFREFEFLVLFSLLIGTGAACYEPAALALFSSQKDNMLKRKAFLYLNLGLNGGAAIGPLLGGFLLSVDPVIPFIMSSLIFLCLAILQLFLIPRSDTQTGSALTSGSLKDILKNKPYLYFCFTMIFYWFLFAQLTVAFPLHMYVLTESEQWVSVVITVNALTGVVLMIVLKEVFQAVEPFILIRLGMLLTACAFLMISLYPGSYWLVICVVIFTIGETMILPSSDYAISVFITQKNDAAYYGFSDFSFAIGATLGNFAGTGLLSQYMNSPVPWLVFTAVGLIGFLISLRLSHRVPHS